jgi:L-aminopeptidase/D-esterase-like protein
MFGVEHPGRARRICLTRSIWFARTLSCWRAVRHSARRGLRRDPLPAERKIGFKTAVAAVPIVPAAIIFDLNLGSRDVRPDATMGYDACLAASTARFAEGNVGAGAGASIGKIFGTALGMKSGVGTASIKVGAMIVGALVVVNSLGDVVDPATGDLIAGLRSGRIGPLRVSAGYLADTAVMKTAGRTALGIAQHTNTALGVVATNVQLDKAGATKVAQMAQDGFAVH